MNSTPDHVYYDLNIVNNNNSDEKLVFNDIRNASILSNPGNYYMSVIRFTLQTSDLPVWIPDINYSSPNPNLTTYSFTLKYKGISSNQTFVLFSSSNITANLPTGPLPVGANYSNPYYYVRSFDEIVDMFNDTLQEAFSVLNINVSSSGLGYTMPTTHAPFFEWNSQNSTFILNGDVNGYDMSNLSSGDYIDIHCNKRMYMLISGLRNYFITENSSDGCNYQLVLKQNANGLNLYKLPTYNVIQSYQEYSTGSLFGPISSIIFCSSLIPIVPTNTGKPNVFSSSSSSLTNSGNNSSITQMITDFEVQDSNGYGYQGSVEYIPSGEYRLVDMMGEGNSTLQNIEITVYWKDPYNISHPLYIKPGARCDIKIMFRKKQFQR